jgi:tripartite-type tricarboxylate transporter receptor subunit TctC
MRQDRRAMLRAATAGGFTLCLPRLARAAWPSERAIEVIVPFPPGGGVDNMVRLIVNFVGRHMPGSRLAVINRPGASGQLGWEVLYGARPDGYTIGALTNTAMLAHSIERTVRYDPEGFTYIANVVEDFNAFWVHPDSPWRNLDDLRDAGRRDAEGIPLGTAGIGSAGHLLMLGFQQLTGAKLEHVPYNGTAPVQRDLLGRTLPVAYFNVSEGLRLFREGRIRCLGQAGPERWGPMSEVPTFREQGYDLVGSAARGIGAPPGLPDEIRIGLETAFRNALTDPEVIADSLRTDTPLRAVIGADYRRMMLTEHASLKRLWQQNPWRR